MPRSFLYPDTPAILKSFLIHASKWKGCVYKVSEIVIYGWNVFATSILRRVIFHFIFKIALKCLADYTKLLNVQLKASSISNL